MSGKKKNFLLTGAPGVGKTTLLIRLSERLEGKAAGFYTAEIKSKGKRRGFELISLTSDLRKTLAHVDYNSQYRVGKYGVRPDNLSPFIQELKKAVEQTAVKWLLIDEIGKMELFSGDFRNMINASLDSHHPVVATIMGRPEKFCDQLKKRPDVTLFELTYANRDTFNLAVIIEAL